MTENTAQQDNQSAVSGQKNVFGLSPEKFRLILTIVVLVAVAIMIAVLVFQIVEFMFYRQPPSAWPSPGK